VSFISAAMLLQQVGWNFFFLLQIFCIPNMIFASNFSWIILHTPPTNHPSAGADEKSVGGGSHGKLVHSFFMIKKVMVWYFVKWVSEGYDLWLHTNLSCHVTFKLLFWRFLCNSTQTHIWFMLQVSFDDNHWESKGDCWDFGSMS